MNEEDDEDESMEEEDEDDVDDESRALLTGRRDKGEAGDAPDKEVGNVEIHAESNPVA